MSGCDAAPRAPLADRPPAIAEARRGDLTTLRQWVETLTDPMPRAFAYAGMVEGMCGRDGKPEVALPTEEEE